MTQSQRMADKIAVRRETVRQMIIQFQMSAQAIADEIGVDPKTVGNDRVWLVEHGLLDPEQTVTCRDGVVYKIRIGRYL